MTDGRREGAGRGERERGAPRRGGGKGRGSKGGRSSWLIQLIVLSLSLVGGSIRRRSVGVKDAAIKAGGRVEVSGPIIKHTYMSEWVGYCRKLVLDGSTFISRLCHPRSAASALHGSLPFCLPTREQVGTLGLSHKFDKRRAASLLHCLSVKGLGPPVWG